ncbi:tumor protein p53-inducible nuclear protein 2 [Notolabrus celidotus]|uniref:tumor protein p53-inducible nuclear protein 2 n=1 Tax=Notolabrus celidotus TaxID=1203425 RepID=UPI00148FDAB3|nr:tumor protein p53-inducible nuclear protein 2 [Notolabrus celidotus]
MFRTITRLLFGGEEETPQEVKSGEVLEEEWHVVSHQEAVLAENQGPELTETQQTSNSPPHGDTVTHLQSDISVLDQETTVQSSSSSDPTSRAIAGSVLHPKALLEVTQLNSIQKAKTWADRHHMTRNAIQRQNRIRQGVHHHSFPLQQPGHRNLSH